MIHTYRDQDALESNGLRRLFPLAAVLVVLGLAVFAFADGSWAERGEGGVGLALFFVFAVLSDRRYRSWRCDEIRLGDDGTCELETKRQVIRLHVNQIGAVTYVRDPDSRADYYICYQDGRVPVTKRMTDFPDFLARLKTLNPAVDLSSFPPDAWPGFGRPEGEERRTSISRRIRGALFPVSVVAALVWLAIQTLGPLRLPSADFVVSLLPFVVLVILWVLLMGYLQRRRVNDLRR